MNISAIVHRHLCETIIEKLFWKVLHVNARHIQVALQTSTRVSGYNKDGQTGYCNTRHSTCGMINSLVTSVDRL